MPRAQPLPSAHERLRRLKLDLSRERASEVRRRFLAHLTAHALPAARCEFRFDPDRKWMFDYCWPEHNVALEVEGGVFSKGRHSRALGFVGDIHKYNRAAELGWIVVRCVPDSVRLKDAPTLSSSTTLATLCSLLT